MKRFAVGLMMGLLTLSVPASARDGWRQFGEAVGGNRKDRESAYEEGRRQALEQQALMAQIEAEHRERERIEAQIRREQLIQMTRDWLAQAWMELGLEHEEAQAVAAVFDHTDEQRALNARSYREGLKMTIEKAIAAYHESRYLLANQLLVAARRLPPDPEPAQPTTK